MTREIISQYLLDLNIFMWRLNAIWEIQSAEMTNTNNVSRQINKELPKYVDAWQEILYVAYYKLHATCLFEQMPGRSFTVRATLLAYTVRLHYQIKFRQKQLLCLAHMFTKSVTHSTYSIHPINNIASRCIAICKSLRFIYGV